MAHGFKTGGRVAGVPNRKTQAAADMLAELNCNPIEGMARIALDETAPIAIRAAMYRELAQYVFPKRRSVEIAGELAAGVSEIRRVIVGWDHGEPHSTQALNRD